MPFNIIYGDITTLKYDAIVNPTSSHLTAAGGVDEAIQSIGGSLLKKELERIGTLRKRTKTIQQLRKRIGNASQPRGIRCQELGRGKANVACRNGYFA